MFNKALANGAHSMSRHFMFSFLLIVEWKGYKIIITSKRRQWHRCLIMLCLVLMDNQ